MPTEAIVEYFGTDRLPLGQQSPEFGFTPLPGQPTTFIRIVGHHDDDEDYGGTPPVVVIKAAEGAAAAATRVTEGAAPTELAGNAGKPVARTALRRTPELDNDSYLLTIEHLAAAGPWYFVIENQEPAGLSFKAWASHDQQATFVPWLERDNFDAMLDSEETGTVTIRNLGIAPLDIDAIAGKPFGGDDSPLTVLATPDVIRPHRTGTLVVKCGPLAVVDFPKSHRCAEVLATNDPFHILDIAFIASHTVRNPGRCRTEDGCVEFSQMDLPLPEELRPPHKPEDFLGTCVCGHLDGMHGVYRMSPAVEGKGFAGPPTGSLLGRMARAAALPIVEVFGTDRLTIGQRSPEFTFTPLGGAPTTFVRIVAHHDDDEDFGGTPPAVLIRAADGEHATATTVLEGAGPLDLPGNAGAPVARASMHRTPELDNDSYLLTVEHLKAAGPWSVAIESREPLGLSYKAWVSHNEESTLSPWAETSFDNGRRVGSGGTISVTILNRGATPLELNATAGAAFGGQGSPLIILAVPDVIGPHRTGKLVVKCGALEMVDFPPTVKSVGDVVEANDALHPLGIGFEVKYPLRHPDRCRKGDDCLEYDDVPPPPPWELRPGETMADYIGLCFCGHKNREHGFTGE